MSEELQELIKRYKRSKIRRVAAVYNDSPPHLRHKVHQMFGIGKEKPAQYHSMISREERFATGRH